MPCSGKSLEKLHCNYLVIARNSLQESSSVSVCVMMSECSIWLLGAGQ